VFFCQFIVRIITSLSDWYNLLISSLLPCNVQIQAAGIADESLSIKANRSSREVTAIYKKEEAVMDVIIRLPSSYPLRAVDVECTRKLGVSENRLRKWMLSMVAFVRNQVTWHPCFPALFWNTIFYFSSSVFSHIFFLHNTLVWTFNLSCYPILFVTSLDLIRIHSFLISRWAYFKSVASNLHWMVGEKQPWRHQALA